MTPSTTSQPRKADAQQRTNEEAARIDAARTNASKKVASPRFSPRPEDDKYFDVPCTD